MQLTYKFRLYPNKEQETKLLNTLELCRQTYNILLAELNNLKIIDRSLIQGLLPDLKICQPEFNKVYSKVLQYESYRIFSNLNCLYGKKNNNKKVGRLRFKGVGWFKTFTYNQSGFKLIITGKRFQILRLSKIGNIKIRAHRHIKGKIKQIAIKRENSNRWYAFIIEDDIRKPKKQKINKIIGIDLGLDNIVYDSEGNKISNPRLLSKYAKRLAKEQRKFSKKKLNSKNRLRVRIRISKIYEKLVNTRNDFLHKLSKYYTDNYDVISMEDLKIANMVHNRYLSKSILDASWNKLIRFIAYKAERAGKLFIVVDHRGTTQRCSNCGIIVKKKLWHRIHKCLNCNIEISRDYNSALEIKRLCLQEIGQELAKSTLVEMRPILNNEHVLSMQQEIVTRY